MENSSSSQVDVAPTHLSNKLQKQILKDPIHTQQIRGRQSERPLARKQHRPKPTQPKNQRILHTKPIRNQTRANTKRLQYRSSLRKNPKRPTKNNSGNNRSTKRLQHRLHNRQKNQRTLLTLNDNRLLIISPRRRKHLSKRSET